MIDINEVTEVNEGTFKPLKVDISQLPDAPFPDVPILKPSDVIEQCDKRKLTRGTYRSFTCYYRSSPPNGTFETVLHEQMCVLSVLADRIGFDWNTWSKLPFYSAPIHQFVKKEWGLNEGEIDRMMFLFDESLSVDIGVSRVVEYLRGIGK